MNIMIVEDDVDIQRFIARALKEHGKQFWLPNDGQEAYQLVKDEGIKPDLIITDQDMPLMNGLEMITQLSLLMQTLPPFILVTGNDNHTQQAKEMGAHAVIMKPFHVDELLTAVSEIFS